MYILEMNKRYLICPILPKAKIEEYGGSVAANNFCYNLISGNGYDNIYSYIPLGRIKPNYITYENPLIEAVFCRRIRNNKLTSKFSFAMESILIFRRIRRNSSVWFYNLPYTIILSFLLLRILKPSVKCYLIMLDFTPGRIGVRAILDAIELFCINHMHGMIKLADSPLFTVKNSVCLPGVVPDDGKEYPNVQNMKKEFLISGALGDNISMLSMLLDAFTQMPDLTLHITGKAPDAKKVEEYASKYKNIIYHGMVEYEEYLSILHSTPFLLSTRDPRYPENQCNFPSKVIEALLHNRILVSTLHYPQLEGIKYFEVGTDIEEFIKDIQAISRAADDDLIQYANQSSIVKERFNVRFWNQRMKKIEEYED